MTGIDEIILKKEKEEKINKIIKNTGQEKKQEIETKEHENLHNKIKKIIDNNGGIYKLLENICKERMLPENNENIKNNWKFNQDKLKKRIDYSYAELSEQIDLIRNSIKEKDEFNDIHYIRNLNLTEKDIEEHINNIIFHELNYNSSHAQRINKKILSFYEPDIVL